MRRLPQAIAITAAAVLLASCGVFDPGRAPSSSTSAAVQSAAGDASELGQWLADAVTDQALENRLRDLEQLTLAADGNRGPGSAGYLAAADHIEAELAATGFYDVRREPFTIQRDHPGKSELRTGDGRVINQQPLSFSPGTTAELSGQLVAPTAGSGCDPADWGAEVAGQIAFADRGGCNFRQLNQAAAAAGAVMVVVGNNRDGGLYGTLDNSQPGDIPITGITRAEAERLRADQAVGPIVLSFRFEQRIEEFPTFNLIAETRTGNPENIVMAGAHLDSVPVGPGINDNGSGSVILLETARQLADAPQPPTNMVRFAWWSGEEWGLLGSIHWVNGLVEANPAELRRLAAYVNIDMVASPNYVIGVYDADGSTFADADLPAGSVGLEQQFTGYFDRIGQPWVDVEMGGSSDHAAFVPSGIPVGGLFTGAGEIKSAAEVELFGGDEAQKYDANYHQASDLLANLNTTALAINGKASAFVIGALAADSSPVNGDRQGNQGVATKTVGYGYAATV